MVGNFLLASEVASRSLPVPLRSLLLTVFFQYYPPMVDAIVLFIKTLFPDFSLYPVEIYFIIRCRFEQIVYLHRTDEFV